MVKTFDVFMLAVSVLGLITAMPIAGFSWLLIPCIAYFGFMSYGHWKGWKSQC